MSIVMTEVERESIKDRLAAQDEELSFWVLAHESALSELETVKAELRAAKGQLAILKNDRRYEAA